MQTGVVLTRSLFPGLKCRFELAIVVHVCKYLETNLEKGLKFPKKNSENTMNYKGFYFALYPIRKRPDFRPMKLTLPSSDVLPDGSLRSFSAVFISHVGFCKSKMYTSDHSIKTGEILSSRQVLQYGLNQNNHFNRTVSQKKHLRFSGV